MEVLWNPADAVGGFHSAVAAYSEAFLEGPQKTESKQGARVASGERRTLHIIEGIPPASEKGVKRAESRSHDKKSNTKLGWPPYCYEADGLATPVLIDDDITAPQHNYRATGMVLVLLRELRFTN